MTSAAAAAAAAADENTLEDVRHKNPRDYHKMHIWCMEPPIRKGVLTADGITQIAEHKYKAGHYTYLDEFCSPRLWEPLTDLLPMWLAPNLVTTLGGCFCLATFILSSLYCKDSPTNEAGNSGTPRWLLLSNGFCLFMYYTLDCMDGKQARRTKSSTPLGQLFDHGMDCLCNLSHLQLVQCMLLVPPHVLLILQSSLQLAFWQAQWEEYYTGTLPHASGKWFGVSEVNYGLASISFFTGIVGREVWDVQVLSANAAAGLPLISYLTNDGPLQGRHVMIIGWMSSLISLIVLSIIRVYKHLNGEGKTFLSAVSKFTSPVMLCVVALWGLPDKLDANAHAGSLSMGLCYCLITIKIIVYSMAKMGYASLQVDILPFVVVVVGCRMADYDNAYLFQALDVVYLIRLLYWVHEAITQLCERLGIQLFRIKVVPKED